MSILLEAHDLVHGDRQDDYGNPADVWSLIAKLWESYINHGATPDSPGYIPLDAKDAVLMMALLKIGREARKEKRDNLVDLAGYAEVADML